MTFVNPADPRLAAFLWEVTDFCQKHKGRWCFVDYPRQKLFRYVAFSHLTGRLIVVIQESIRVVAFAWPDWTERIEARAEYGQPQFSWTHTLKDTDALFVGEVIADRQVLERSDLEALWIAGVAKYKDLSERKIFTYRHGRLVELTKDKLRRFLHG